MVVSWWIVAFLPSVRMGVRVQSGGELTSIALQTVVIFGISNIDSMLKFLLMVYEAQYNSLFIMSYNREIHVLNVESVYVDRRPTSPACSWKMR